MKTFSPIDSIDLLSASPQLTVPKTSSRLPCWLIVLTILVIAGLLILIYRGDQKNHAKPKKP